MIARGAKATLTRARALNWRLNRRLGAEGLRIFLYHRISDDLDPLALRPRRFREQMEHLAAEGYRAVDASSALDEMYGGTLDPKLVAVTFDDGFADIREYALPVLSELGFSASVFVATGIIDGKITHAWTSRRAPMLSWDEIRDLDAGGVLLFEPHSLTHPNLTRLSEDACRREIVESKVALETQIGRETSAFCYPGGFFNLTVRDLTRSAGFRYGVTCEPGVNSPETDPHLVNRVQIDRTDSLKDFAAKVLGSHDSPLPGRRHYRRLRHGFVP